MRYVQEYHTRPEHIDVQGIMDGLYYPFYMEECRHRFLRDVLGLDIEEQAKQGVNIVLTQYTIKFKRPLKRDDRFLVSCEARPDANRLPVFHLIQEIERAGKLVTEGIFTATFVSAAGGRSYIPDTLSSLLSEREPLALSVNPTK